MIAVAIGDPVAWLARSRCARFAAGLWGEAMEPLIERVKTILLTPEVEWRVIASEPDDILALFIRYVAVLALIPALAGFFGVSLFGHGSILAALIGAAVGYVLTFAAVFIVTH